MSHPFQWFSGKLANRLGLLAMTMSLSFWTCSCATPQPPQAYQGTDRSALVIDSVNPDSCRVLSPLQTDFAQTTQVLNRAHALPERHTAVVILENYNEPTLGNEFRDRSVPIFLGLRGAGYQSIYFLQGHGVNDPDGLLTLARYD